MLDTCELCQQPGGVVLWQGERIRVIRVGGNEADLFPGFCRVIWLAHVREMSDLATQDAAALMQAVCAVERAVRAVLMPDKINLACLGNLVPHLHWHVIPRWEDDSHFPRPIWAAALREKPLRNLAADWQADLAQAVEEQFVAIGVR